MAMWIFFQGTKEEREREREREKERESESEQALNVSETNVEEERPSKYEE